MLKSADTPVLAHPGPVSYAWFAMDVVIVLAVSPEFTCLPQKSLGHLITCITCMFYIRLVIIVFLLPCERKHNYFFLKKYLLFWVDFHSQAEEFMTFFKKINCYLYLWFLFPPHHELQFNKMYMHYYTQFLGLITQKHELQLWNGKGYLILYWLSVIYCFDFMKLKIFRNRWFFDEK